MVIARSSDHQMGPTSTRCTTRQTILHAVHQILAQQKPAVDKLSITIVNRRNTPKLSALVGNVAAISFTAQCHTSVLRQLENNWHTRTRMPNAVYIHELHVPSVSSRKCGQTCPFCSIPQDRHHITQTDVSQRPVCQRDDKLLLPELLPSQTLHSEFVESASVKLQSLHILCLKVSVLHKRFTQHTELTAKS